ncbi:MAG TPA: SpoIIE family protein phosphatase [Candidatus Ozemobacteraceae bacterium]|nr:SpoIIE family protein phosphatase [Candidatus Ozemobacteraceae bacterium]
MTPRAGMRSAGFSFLGMPRESEVTRTVLFGLGWAVALGILLARPQNSALWAGAILYLVVAMALTVRSWLQYRREIRFLREFQHLSQTLDDIRELDTERPFDHILESVQRIVGFDRAVIFLEDEQAQTLRAVQAIDLDEERRAAMVIPKSEGSLIWKLLKHTEACIISRSPWTDPDMARWLDLLRTDAVALAPIARGGKCWGMLLVDRHVEKEPITDDDLLQLQVLADQVGITFQNHSLNEELSRRATLVTAQNERYKREVQLAKLVQDGVLPRTPPNWPGLVPAVCLRSARVIGGDFFTYLETCGRGRGACNRPSCDVSCPDKLFGMLIGDVCGKGIPAALVMAVVNCLFREKVAGCADPACLLSEVNVSLKDFLGAESRLHSSAFVGFVSKATNRFVYANAGHDFPLLWRASTGKLEPLESTGTLIGIFRESAFTTRTVELAPGDAVFLYTDGLTDFFEQERGAEDGYEMLQAWLLERLPRPPAEIIAEIEKMIDASTAESHDDISAAMLTYEG